MEWFVKRTTSPVKGEKWFSTNNPEAGGKYDMFIKHNGHLGNCTQYAYGRFSYLHNKDCKMPSYNVVCKDGRNWYDNAPNTYARGKKPRLGAIIVLQHTTKSNGHVGIVEEIKANGDIVCSMSGYASYLFKLKTLTKKSGYVYSDYKLLGFVYPNKKYFQLGKWKTLSAMNVRKSASDKAKIVCKYMSSYEFEVSALVKKGNQTWGKTKDGYICLQGKKQYCDTL